MIVNPCAEIFMDKLITVFYGDQVYDEYANWREMVMSMVPDGAYVYSNNVWYHKKVDYHVITEAEVPAMCKAWILIL